jgi:hypothetical protein
MEADDVRRVVAGWFPSRPAASVVRLGSGVDHVAWLVDGDLIVRFGSPDPIRESRVLTAVAAVSPVPVPHPLVADADLGCLAYRVLDGTPLLHAPPGGRWRGGGAHAARAGVAVPGSRAFRAARDG